MLYMGRPPGSGQACGSGWSWAELAQVGCLRPCPTGLLSPRRWNYLGVALRGQRYTGCTALVGASTLSMTDEDIGEQFAAISIDR